MGNSSKESLHALTGQHTAATSAHRDGNYDRESRLGLMDAIQGSLSVKSVETSLDYDKVYSAFNQGASLLGIGIRHLIKAAGAPFRTNKIGY